MRGYALHIVISLLLLTGCIKPQPQDNSFHQQLTVEGRIEQGSEAIVMLSTNTQYSDEYDNDTFKDMVVRWGKVTLILESGEEEVLTGRVDKDYPTQYIYTSTLIEGEVGCNYAIEIEYSDQTWYAQTTILPPMTLSDIEVVDESNDTYSIHATLPPSSEYCSIDCSINHSSYFAPTLLGTYAPSSTPRRITINHPFDSLNRKNYSTFFKGDEIVELRVNTLSDFSYNYWRKWEDNFINSLNPVFPSTSNLPTNISNNGIGIWAGYGTTYYSLGKLSEHSTN